MAAADEGMVKLLSSDGKEVPIPVKHAMKCNLLKNMLDDLGVDEATDAIPVEKVNGEILEKIKDYCAKHEDDKTELTPEEETELREQPITGWDKDFIDVPLATLFHMILAANFLDIKSMLNLTCKGVAEMIKGKSPDEIKKIFGIEGEFTEEEKRAVYEEHDWLREEAPKEDEEAAAAAPSE
eukprot:CAMPEP_0182915650 /NCGR_PEP_ID=MMETSP0105_2-20130417/455_1 /TAXON_ID=81532 ORGANISM="Acanthoeca-like sp., Strain 10tr" /NCGR_SAMPLE_ID=MMETSP0105_2 /ASSEMBLY_ACC=CAM_ASM_000205 /LENGTH=181 /DNA_ID=CAMNT_0025052529 /DNA_START=87 /DNA_END=632 /DNA_ORIENTATION=+